MDIFIISISICLSTRFNQLNEHLKQYKGMVSAILLFFFFCFFFQIENYYDGIN